MASIWLINGPNLNRLGKREVAHYGNRTLADIEAGLVARAEAAGHQLEAFQRQGEGELVDLVHDAADNDIDILLLNPAAYTHSSIALRDALLCTELPFIEIHLSNIWRREAFRQQSYFHDIALGQVTGFGSDSYDVALEAALRYLARTHAPNNIHPLHAEV